MLYTRASTSNTRLSRSPIALPHPGQHASFESSALGKFKLGWFLSEVLWHGTLPRHRESIKRYLDRTQACFPCHTFSERCKTKSKAGPRARRPKLRPSLPWGRVGEAREKEQPTLGQSQCPRRSRCLLAEFRHVTCHIMLAVSYLQKPKAGCGIFKARNGVYLMRYVPQRFLSFHTF